MKIFGGVLPFIGYRVEEVDDQMRRFFDFDDDVSHINTFQLEWFWRSIVICLSPVEPGE